MLSPSVVKTVCTLFVDTKRMLPSEGSIDEATHDSSADNLLSDIPKSGETETLAHVAELRDLKPVGEYRNERVRWREE